MRRLVLVEIDADTALAAEQIVGRALMHAAGAAAKAFVRQTNVIVKEVER